MYHCPLSTRADHPTTFSLSAHGVSMFVHMFHSSKWHKPRQLDEAKKAGGQKAGGHRWPQLELRRLSWVYDLGVSFKEMPVPFLANPGCRRVRNDREPNRTFQGSRC